LVLPGAKRFRGAACTSSRCFARLPAGVADPICHWGNSCEDTVVPSYCRHGCTHSSKAVGSKRSCDVACRESWQAVTGGGSALHAGASDSHPRGKSSYAIATKSLCHAACIFIPFSLSLVTACYHNCTSAQAHGQRCSHAQQQKVSSLDLGCDVGSGQLQACSPARETKADATGSGGCSASRPASPG